MVKATTPSSLWTSQSGLVSIQWAVHGGTWWERWRITCFLKRVWSFPLTDTVSQKFISSKYLDCLWRSQHHGNSSSEIFQAKTEGGWTRALNVKKLTWLFPCFLFLILSSSKIFSTSHVATTFNIIIVTKSYKTLFAKNTIQKTLGTVI